MKKEYLAPMTEVLDVMVSSMLASSTSGEVTPGGDSSQPAANDRRGAWGDFWN